MPSFQPGAVLNTQSLGNKPESVEVPHYANRAPTTSDIRYPVGKRWVNTTSGAGAEYCLTDFTSSAGTLIANWAFLGSSSGDLNSLTTQDATVVLPTAGTILFDGAANQLTTTGSNSPGTVTVSLVNSVITPGSLQVTGLLTTDAGITATGGALSLNSGTNSIGISTDASATAISIGTGAAVVKTIAIGGTGANVITIGNTQTAGSVSVGAAMTTGTVSIGGTGLQTGTVSIAPGTGAQIVNIATGGTGIKTVNIGTAAVANVISIGSSSAGVMTIASGSTIGITGTTNINTTGSAVTSIGTGGTGATNIGNATGNTAVTGSLTASTTLTATLGAITATNGNFVFGTAGNKTLYSSVASTTTAGANSAGSVALSSGAATVATSSVTGSSLIRLTRQGINSSTALGSLTINAISANTNFIIKAVDATTPANAITGDTSIIFWEIVN